MMARARPSRSIVVVAAVLGLLSGPVTADRSADQRLRTARSIPPDAQAAIEAVLAEYERGIDIAVERWQRTIEGRSLARYVVPVLGTTTWSRGRAAFFLEMAVAAAPVDPRLATSFLQAGLSLLLTRPPGAGAPAADAAFERLWHRTALGIAQGLLQYALQRDYLDRITPRLTTGDLNGADGSRMPLARAIASAGFCCRSPSGRQAVELSIGRVFPTVDDTIALFSRAADVPALRAEALVRGGLVYFGENRFDDAVAWFDRAGADHGDVVVGFVQELTRGRALDQLKRHGEAAKAYEAAHAYDPTSQLAATGFAAALLRSSQPDAAMRVASIARQLPPEQMDLRREFARADARFVRDWLAEIRRLRR